MPTLLGWPPRPSPSATPPPQCLLPLGSCSPSLRWNWWCPLPYAALDLPREQGKPWALLFMLTCLFPGLIFLSPWGKEWVSIIVSLKPVLWLARSRCFKSICWMNEYVLSICPIMVINILIIRGPMKHSHTNWKPLKEGKGYWTQIKKKKIFPSL